MKFYKILFSQRNTREIFLSVSLQIGRHWTRHDWKNNIVASGHIHIYSQLFLSYSTFFHTPQEEEENVFRCKQLGKKNQTIKDFRNREEQSS